MVLNKLYHWGYNADGQCGVGNITNVLTPTLVLSDVVKVFLGNWNSHTSSNESISFAVRLIGGKEKLYACGHNTSEDLGIGNYLGGFITTYTKVLIPEDEEVVINHLS